MHNCNKSMLAQCYLHNCSSTHGAKYGVQYLELTFTVTKGYVSYCMLLQSRVAIYNTNNGIATINKLHNLLASHN